MNANPRISTPHLRRESGSGYRCRLKTLGGKWVQGPTRVTEEEALAAAAEKLAAMDAGAEPPPVGKPEPSPAAEADAPAQDQDPPKSRPAAPQARSTAVGVRILGPYAESGGWRCKIKTSAGQRSAPLGRTEREALRLAERVAADLARLGGLTIRDSIDVLVAEKSQNGARQATLDGTRRALVVFWRELLDGPISRVTERSAQQQYDRLRQGVDPRTGRQLSVDTQRCYLKHGKAWARWVIKQGWLRGPSPLDGIQAVGRRRRGKPQLTRIEVSKLISTCLEVATDGDLGAVAVLLAIFMGLRASEVLSRVVRDIDAAEDPDSGEQIQVLHVCDREELDFRLKTGESARSPAVHPLLQPLLAKLAAGKEPTDPLFPGRLGGQRRRQWLWVEVKRFCTLSKVPVVSPHALRGTLATQAGAAGVRLDLISAVLGHGSTSITQQHYLRPGTLDRAQRERGLLSLRLPRQHTPLPS